MKKTILFDLDGTLTDSGEGIINCVIPYPLTGGIACFCGSAPAGDVRQIRCQA